MTLDDYMQTIAQRVAAHRQREQEEADEAEAAKQRALETARAYVAGLRVEGAGDAA